MLAKIAYRGPDHEGVTSYSGIRGDHLTVGQKRLAILDPSPEAHQPFENIQGTSSLTFNGEFYNFRRLRDKIPESDHVFRTQSDAEVALHLLDSRGSAALVDLWGMFAFLPYRNKSYTQLNRQDRSE